MQHYCVFNKEILNPIKRHGFVDLGKKVCMHVCMYVCRDTTDGDCVMISGTVVVTANSSPLCL